MIAQPYPSFIDPKVGGRAKPVSNGTIFIGQNQKDQIQSPEKVYYTDSNGTEIEMAQPIYLNSAGVTVDSKNSSTVIRPYTKSASYSILIKNSNDNPIYISDSVSGYATKGWVESGVAEIIATGSTTPRSLNDRFADSLSVKDFGAVGDGVVDDTLAVQAALNKTGVLDLAQGTYSVDTLTLPANTTIRNGRLNLRTANTALLVLNSNCHIEDVQMYGSGNTVENLSERLVQVGAPDIGTVSNLISNVSITDSKLHNTNGYAVRMAYTQNVRINNNTFENMRYSGVFCVGCSNVQVNSNRINNITGLASNQNAYGVTFTTDSTISTSAGGRITDVCTASDNVITNVSTWNALDTHGGRNITFSNNTIKNCKFCIGIVNAPKPESLTASARYVTCDGNTMDNTSISTTGASFGITVSGEVNYPCINVAITGNTLMRCGEPENNIGGAINIKDTLNCVISGNSVHQPKVFGINVYTRNAGVSVTGNVVIDPFDDVVTVPTGIVIRAEDNTGIVDGNTLHSTGNSVGAYTSVRGIDVSTGSGNKVVFGSNYSNYATPIRGINLINADLGASELVDETGVTPNSTVSPVGDTTTDQSAIINNNFSDLTTKVNQLIRISKANGWAI